MSKTISGKDVIRAWKDADYRESLNADDRAALPNHPAGWVDISDAELESVRGAVVLPTPNCVPGTATGASQCSINPCITTGLANPCQITFAAPIPGNGCQLSVHNWTCTNPLTL